LSLNDQGNFDLSGYPSPSEILSAEFFELAQNRPYSHHKYAACGDELTNIVDIMPEDTEALRVVSNSSSVTMLVRTGGDMIMYVNHTRGSSVRFVGASSDLNEPREVIESMVKDIPPRQIDEDRVPLWLWHRGPSGPDCKSKVIKAPTWEEVGRNYTSEASGSLGELMKMEKPENSGKIILWHGAPGTGKTSAIRTLMREWKSWCNFHYVSDPEDMFKNPSYLMTVSTSDDNAWRLVIAEDCDGLLRPDARNDTGNGLGRLLNFSDGILGQGTNTLFLLTTNVQLDSLHPALTRPGRCLGQMEFKKFTRKNMMDWMPEGVTVPNQEMTLAEMIDHVNKRKISTGLETKQFGTYI
jgi:hypothetical protein